MGVSIMLTTIPRPPPGNGLFLQGKAWTDKPSDSTTGTKSHPVASPPLTAVASSLFVSILFSFLSFFPLRPWSSTTTYVLSSFFLFSLLPSCIVLVMTDGHGFIKWYSELLWLWNPGERRARETSWAIAVSVPSVISPTEISC